MHIVRRFNAKAIDFFFTVVAPGLERNRRGYSYSHDNQGYFLQNRAKTRTPLYMDITLNMPYLELIYVRTNFVLRLLCSLYY